MVTQVQQDEMTWYTCEDCGLMFDNEDDADRHEQRCDATEPTYLQ